MFRIVTTLLAIGLLADCSSTPKAPAVAESIRKSLDRAGLERVSVTQNRDKGVVTLGGHVATDADKANANQIAQSMATDQVVANEVAILPPSGAGPTRAMNADLDEGIDKNLDAALISNGYRTGIHHSVKSEVVTLTGTVDTERQRAQLDT